MISPAKYKMYYTVLKIVLACLLLSVLYQQIWQREDLSEIMGQIDNSIATHGYTLLIIAILLMPINWLTESIKWHKLIVQIQDFSLPKSIKSVLSGVSMAIMTPARIGEYGGRLIGIEGDKRGQAIVANFISSLSQNIINIGVGLLATYLFFLNQIEFSQSTKSIILCTGLAANLFLIIIYFRLSMVSKILDMLPKWKWIVIAKTKFEEAAQINGNTLLQLLILSLFRYSVYLTQYILLIFFFAVSRDIYTATIGVATVFFIQSNLPLPPFLSVLARGELAILLWSTFTDNTAGIIAATFTLWFVNLVVPALVGLIILTKHKIDPDASQ